MGPIFHIAFQGIDGHDGFIIVEERIVIGRQLCADVMNLFGIQAHKRNCEAVPHFLLELRHHAFDRDDKDTLSLAAGNQLAHQDTSLQRFAQADRVRNKKALPWPSERNLRRLQLIGHQIHRSFIADMQIRVGRDLLPPLAFQV